MSGEPVSIGRQTRLWPAPMRRAIIGRDRHCQFPGCHATRSLTIHHIRSWLRGGETSVENAMCLCQAHHTLVHEGGYRITRRHNEPRRFDITAPVTHASNAGTGSGKCNHNHSTESTADELRNDDTLSKQAEQLLPTRHRFDVQKPDGAIKTSAAEKTESELATVMPADTSAEIPHDEKLFPRGNTFAHGNRFTH